MASYFSMVTGRVPTRYTLIKGNLHTVDDWMTRNKISPAHLRALNELITEGFLTDSDWKYLDEEGKHSEKVLKEIYKRAGIGYKTRSELIIEKKEADEKARKLRTGETKTVPTIKQKGKVQPLPDEQEDGKPVKMRKVNGEWVSE